MAKPIQSLEEFNTIVKANKIVIVDFFATWCRPCTNIAPVYQEMAKKYGKSEGTQFVKVDVDKCPDVAEQCKVNSMPTFIIYVDGKESERWSGAGRSDLKLRVINKLQEVIGAPFKPDPEDVEGTELDTRGSFWYSFFLILIVGSMLLQFIAKRS